MVPIVLSLIYKVMHLLILVKICILNSYKNILWWPFNQELLPGVFQDVNDVYRYLSGVAVTPRTEFLQLGQPEVMDQYKMVIHYMKFAMAAYGWPLFMMMNTGTGLCRMMPYLR